MENQQHLPTSEEKHQMIAQAAYFHAEKRGFADGDPIEDWLVAEAEIEKSLREAHEPKPRKQELAAYAKMRLEMKKLLTDTHDAINAETIRRAIDKVNREIREIGEFVPETVDKANHLLKREIAATIEKMGSRLGAFSEKSAGMFNVWKGRGANFLNQASHALNDWVKKYRNKK